jgi:HEAT repeat protein/cyclophilin family peptidyl-prolyl cis-trans isomerase
VRVRLKRWLLVGAYAVSSGVAAQAPERAPLTPADVDAIVQLVAMADRRAFDATVLTRLLKSTHPEVRRRAVLAVGRLADPRGRALLITARGDADTAVAATVVFSTGQLKDSAAVSWLDSLLVNVETPWTVAQEAAFALGKIRSPEAHASLLRFLARAPDDARHAPIVGEALYAVGRFTTIRGDLAPVARWTATRDVELRGRATWALWRPGDPAALTQLLRLSNDTSGIVRSWTVRGMTPARADSAGIGRMRAAIRLYAAARDDDRRVSTEAIRALGGFSDSTTFALLVSALGSSDTWISVTAAEAFARQEGRTADAIPRLVAATASSKPRALRVTALRSLLALSVAAAAGPATEMARDSASFVRLEAARAFARLGAEGKAGLESLRNDPVPQVRLQAWQALHALTPANTDIETRRSNARMALASADVAVRAAMLRSTSSWVQAADIPMLLDAYQRALQDSVPWAATASVIALGTVQRQASAGAAEFLRRFPKPNPAVRREVDRQFGEAARRVWGELRPIDTGRTDADYRRIVERWVLPDYQGAARPRAQWETARGTIELELYAGDAPIAVDDFVRFVESGQLVGVEFGRVVPDFVAQQSPIREDRDVRDEVNRYRLTRGNLSWASSGLDTGRPGYTLGNTAQPHNEGDFTSMGRVVNGFEALDHLELGDRILGARMMVTTPRRNRP